MRILIAEDEPELAAALEAMLKREHYSVDVVHDGDDALDYGLAENYDGLVLDIMMPRRDGLEVLRLLREKGVSTPVLLLTARSGVDDRIRGLNAGADDYLPKPFDMGRLGAPGQQGVPAAGAAHAPAGRLFVHRAADGAHLGL